MTIANSVADDKLKKPSTQVGLNNLKQRLSFIYNGDFKLDEKKFETRYETTLLIPIQRKLP